MYSPTDKHNAVEEKRRSDLIEFLRQRDDALRTLDMDFARKLMPGASSDEVRLMALHKARYETTSMEPALRHASRAWLAERGYKRLTGTDLLPEGVLPE